MADYNGDVSGRHWQPQPLANLDILGVAAAGDARDGSMVDALVLWQQRDFSPRQLIFVVKL